MSLPCVIGRLRTSAGSVKTVCKDQCGKFARRISARMTSANTRVPVGHVPGRKLCAWCSIPNQIIVRTTISMGTSARPFFDAGGKFGELVRTGTCPGGTCPPWKLTWGHLSALEVVLGALVKGTLVCWSNFFLILFFESFPLTITHPLHTLINPQSSDLTKSLKSARQKVPQSARLSAGGGVQLLFGQCPNRGDAKFKGASLKPVD